MNSLGKTIKSLRKSKGMRQDELARQVGVSAQLLSRLENDKHKQNVQLLEKISRALEVSVVDLLQMGDADNTLPQSPHTIPLLGSVNDSGAPTTLQFNSSGLPTSPSIGDIGIITPLPQPDCYALIIKDNSMDPFERDWTVIVSPHTEVQHRSFVVALVDGKLLLRRVHIEDYNTLTLHASKGFFEPVTLEKDDVRVLHKAWTFIAP